MLKESPVKRFHSTGTELMTTAIRGGVCLMGAIAGVLLAYFRLIHFKVGGGFLGGLLQGPISGLDRFGLDYLADRRNSSYGRYRRSGQCSFSSVLQLG